MDGGATGAMFFNICSIFFIDISNPVKDSCCSSSSRVCADAAVNPDDFEEAREDALEGLFEWDTFEECSVW
jgi:hypothetical protein